MNASATIPATPIPGDVPLFPLPQQEAVQPPIEVLDGCAGPGGWSVAVKALGLREVGIEIDPAACATRAAAGHLTVRADISLGSTKRLRRLAGRIRGLIFSPPCGTFSAAGKQEGVGDLPLLHKALDEIAAGKDPRPELAAACSDPRTPLVVEPLRYALAIRPEWIALEQVPAVLPLWKHMARILRAEGYSTWTGILNAADYGVVAACPLHKQSTDPVPDAAKPSQFATALGYAVALATTHYDAALAPLAATAAALLASRIRPAFAASATCVERGRILAALAASVDPTTRAGEEVATWTSEGTSGFGLTAATVANIASLLSNCLADPSLAKKWSTTSMETRRTIVHRISRCIAATLITGCGTGPATREADCGLCVDVAVPQTRRRAILIASRVRTVARPEPTHAKAAEPETLFGPGRRRWVSMAEALGWGATARPVPTITAGGGQTGGAEPFPTRAREILAEERDRGAWVLHTNRDERPDGSRQTADPYAAPAPSLTGKSGGQWVLRSGQSVAGEGRAERTADEPSVSITSRADQCAWADARPATTVCATDRVAKPGHRDREGGEAQYQDSVRITVEEAAALQSFPADYPFQGTKTAKFLQVGNAVPPLLALHVLAAATGIKETNDV